jgi:hypothetical protein
MKFIAVTLLKLRPKRGGIQDQSSGRREFKKSVANRLPVGQLVPADQEIT